MATPRVSINELPEQTTVDDADLLVVQDTTTTKKMTVGRLTLQTEAGINAHINDTDDAHDASAISAVANASPMTGGTVQAQLAQAAGGIASATTSADSASTNLTAHLLDATDAHDASAISVIPSGDLTSTNVQAALIELQVEITTGGGGSGGGGGITAEDAVDAVASQLVAGAGIGINYNDAANEITITSTATGGGGVTYASFTFNSTTTEPPSTSQLRINNASQTAATRLWVSKMSFAGNDVSSELARVLGGHQMYIQDLDDASKWVKYTVASAGVDDGTYYDFTVAYHSGSADVPFGTVEFQRVAPGTVGVPPGGTVDQALVKDSSTDYDQSWQTLTVAQVSGLQAALNTKPSSTTIDTITSITQAAYDALGTPDPATLYFIT